MIKTLEAGPTTRPMISVESIEPLQLNSLRADLKKLPVLDLPGERGETLVASSDPEVRQRLAELHARH